MLHVAEHFSDSDVGRQRQGNEDSYFVRSPLFVVADGMGGAQAGEVASAMAVRSFEPGVPEQDPAGALAGIVREANRRIHERSRSDRRRAGMGTTLTAAYLSPSDEVVIAHVGDSRCYLLRGGELVRLTQDHSLVGELVARGKLTEEQAETHPQRSVITRALGPEPDVEVDVEAFSAQAGDVFLVCSDGLTSMLPEAEVREIAARPVPLERRGRELIAAANRAGGRDNITVVLFRVEDSDAPASGARAGVAGATAPVDAAGPDGDPGSARATLPEEPPASPAGAMAQTTAMEAVAPRERPESEPAPAVPLAAPAGARPDMARAAATTGAARPDHDRASDAARGARRRGRPWLRILGAFVLLVLPIFIALWMASRAVYFIGTDPGPGNVVTIYRGVPYELPGGIELYERFYRSGVTLGSVPESRREIFTNHQLRSRDDAEDLVIALERGELNQ